MLVQRLSHMLSHFLPPMIITRGLASVQSFWLWPTCEEHKAVGTTPRAQACVWLNIPYELICAVGTTPRVRTNNNSVLSTYLGWLGWPTGYGQVATCSIWNPEHSALKNDRESMVNGMWGKRSMCDLQICWSKMCVLHRCSCSMVIWDTPAIAE